jgi:hypothetical protein
MSKKKEQQPKIAIHISGGMLNCAYSNVPGLKLVLVDVDDLDADGKTGKQIGDIWQRAKRNTVCVY